MMKRAALIASALVCMTVTVDAGTPTGEYVRKGDWTVAALPVASCGAGPADVVQRYAAPVYSLQVTATRVSIPGTKLSFTVRKNGAKGLIATDSEKNIRGGVEVETTVGVMVAPDGSVVFGAMIRIPSKNYTCADMVGANFTRKP